MCLKKLLIIAATSVVAFVSSGAAQPVTFCTDSLTSQGTLLTNGSQGCDQSIYIITSQYALAPAHCVDGLPVNRLELVFGGAISNPQAVRTTASSYIMHENYNPFWLQNDLALIRFAAPIPPSSTISYLAAATVAENYQDWIYSATGVDPSSSLHLHDGDAIYSCPLLPLCSSPQASAQIFLRGLEYDNSYATVCLNNLGIFDPSSGAQTGTNYSAPLGGYVLNGKYVQTALQSLAPTLQRFVSPSNQFSVVPSGSSSADARRSALWSAEAHLYYYINDFRSRFVNETFVNSLGLSPAIAANLNNFQYRPNLQGIVNARLPIAQVTEVSAFTPWATDVPGSNITAPVKARTAVVDPLDSFAFDPEWVIGQYAGMMSNWIAAGNAQWPSNPTWGTIDASYTWRTDIRPAILEGFKLWNAYRYLGNSEVYRYAMQVHRRLNSSSCGTSNMYACDKGWNIANALMYLDSADPVLNNPSNASWPANNSDDTLLFPYKVRSAVPANHGGPALGGGLGGMYIAALFYDISKEIGLGDYKADQLFWKTMSLIDPAQAISMTTFGQKIQQAARALWPVTGNPAATWYEADLVDVLSARGIRMNGAANFLDNVPAPIGTAANPGPGTLTTASTVGLGSPIPESQRNSTTGYNFLSFFQNTYVVSTAGTQYVTYQFYKNSRYGPSDSLDLTNGTINLVSSNNPVMNYDGSMSVNYSGRALGNMLLMAPGTSLSFLRRRQSAVSEREGYYAEDNRPFGFRVVKAIPNGFTFSVARTGETSTTVSYSVSIVDPSLTLTGPNTGPATYNWTFTAYDGTVVNASGQVVSYTALKDQPFTVAISRVRGGTETITLRERGNDFDRNSGAQFNQNFMTVGYPVSFDTIINRRLVEGHGSYNSALNPVGGAFGVQARRWTTPGFTVKPLTFSTVSHGIGSGSNQNGPYYFQNAVYYNACIWSTRNNVTNFPGCHTNSVDDDFEAQVPFSQVGITIGDPFAIVTAGSYPGHLWTVNYPADWRLDPNHEYYFGSHISASVVNNGYSYNVCSYAQAAGTAGAPDDRSDWLAGANWSGQSGSPVPQTMRQYLSSPNSVSNCTYAAYRFSGVTVPQ